MRGAAKIVFQRGDRGTYANVEIEVTPEPGGQRIRLERAPGENLRAGPSDSLGYDWEAAVRFGLDHAWERARRSRAAMGGALVRLVDVHIHNQWDTPPIAVAYVAAQALWNAIEYPENLRHASFDGEGGKFVFAR
jgi:hypothetical protein